MSLVSRRMLSTSATRVREDKFEKAISAENMASCVQFLQALKMPARYRKSKQTTSFAVLICFCRDRDSRPSLLVQQRSLKLRRDPGMICFPGGLQDESDSSDHVATALRETEEEIGLDASRIRVYGLAAPFQTRNDQGMLYPAVGFIDLDFSHGRDPFKLNREEVQAVHLVPLENLVKSENWRYTRFKPSGLALPVYRDTVFNDKQVPRIWGLTGMMIHFVMMATMPHDYRFTFDIIRLVDS